MCSQTLPLLNVACVYERARPFIGNLRRPIYSVFPEPESYVLRYGSITKQYSEHRIRITVTGRSFRTGVFNDPVGLAPNEIRLSLLSVRLAGLLFLWCGFTLWLVSESMFRPHAGDRSAVLYL